MLPDLSRDEVQRYSRHLMLPEVGLAGQRKLKAASALIVGTGGLGSPISLYLAAAGIGRIGLVDFDAVEVSNLQRQVIHGTSSLGQPKVLSARQRLLEINPQIQVEACLEVFSAENAERLAVGYDVLVDGTDNFPTRYLLNDLAFFQGKPYIYGSVFRFEGQVSTFDARIGPCYRCLFPEPPPPGLLPGCSTGGVLGAIPGTIGTLQATEVIKVILGIGSPLIGRLLLYDGLEGSFQPIGLRKNPNCRLCGGNPDVKGLIDYDEFCGSSASEAGQAPVTPWEMAPSEVLPLLKGGGNIRLLDVREPVEQQVSRIEGATNIPFGHLASRLGELDRGETIVAFCRTGLRAAQAVQILRGAGFEHAFNLSGGINAWARQVDPALYEY